MRLIGHLENAAHARTLGNYLLAAGYPNQVEREEDGRWAVWIHHDDHVAPARAVLERFRADPGTAEFRKVARAAAPLRREETRKEEGARQRHIDARTKVFFTPPAPMGLLTAIFGIAAIVVGIHSSLGDDLLSLQPLVITRFLSETPPFPTGDLSEILRGELWRFVTPAFIHFGFLHLLFNLMWLKDLGSIIELRKGHLFLGVFFVLTAALSNIAQYATNGPIFGGLSGVNYALFGYVWISGKFNPRAELTLSPHNTTLMLGWFILCLTGLMGNVANTAHAAGLAAGAVWGYLASGHVRKLLRGE
ncbi:MAG: rhomboid family intramembrane serine protease [Planctomycetota bacterium]